jgi:hypothetical protein
MNADYYSSLQFYNNFPKIHAVRFILWIRQLELREFTKVLPKVWIWVNLGPGLTASRGHNFNVVDMALNIHTTHTHNVYTYTQSYSSKD